MTLIKHNYNNKNSAENGGLDQIWGLFFSVLLFPVLHFQSTQNFTQFFAEKRIPGKTANSA